MLNIEAKKVIENSIDLEIYSLSIQQFTADSALLLN